MDVHVNRCPTLLDLKLEALRQVKSLLPLLTLPVESQTPRRDGIRLASQRSSRNGSLQFARADLWQKRRDNTRPEERERARRRAGKKAKYSDGLVMLKFFSS